MKRPSKVQGMVFLTLTLLSGAVAQEPGQQNPELVLQTGHNGWIRSIAFSPDGKTLASGSQDNTVKFWDARTGMLKRTLVGHRDGIVAVAFSANGKNFASASLDGIVNLWDAQSGNLMLTLNSDGHPVWSLVFSPDSRRLAGGGGLIFGEIKLWDLETGKLQTTLKDVSLSDPTIDRRNTVASQVYVVYSVAFSPDGRTLASAGSDKLVRLWDAHTGELLQSMVGHSGTVWSLCFSPDGNTLASASEDKSLILWNPYTGKALRSVVDRSSLTAVTFAPDGFTLASGGMDGTIKLRDPKSAAARSIITAHNLPVWSVAFSPDSAMLATGSGDSTVKLWDSRSAELDQTLPSHYGDLTSISFSPDGTVLACGGYGSFRLWDAYTGRLKYVLIKNGEPVWSVAFSPDGKIVASAHGKEIKLWDTQTGELQQILKGHQNFVYSVIFSPDGKTLVSGSEDNTVRFWNSQTGEALQTLTENSGAVYSIAFSPNGNVIATAGEGANVSLWDARTRVLLNSISEDSGVVYALAFSPDGQTLATGNVTKQVKLWHAKSGQLERVLAAPGLVVSHGSSVKSLAFSPDGKTLASGSDDATIRLWDVVTGALKRTLVGHSNLVRSVSFSSDGKTLASASYDTTVRLWCAETGALMVTVLGLPDGSWIDYTQRGYYMATKGARRAIGFRVGDRVFPFEQFDLKLNRPDLVLESIGRSSSQLILAYRNAYLKRLSRTGFTEKELGTDFHLPTISLASRNQPARSTERKLTFRIAAADTQYALDRLNVYVNDVPVYDVNGLSLKGRGVRKIEREIVINLSNGKNKIQVSVLNEKGAESLKETFNVSYDGPAVKPNLYVAAIGVSTYVDGRYALSYADKDAHDLSAFFKSKNENFGHVFVRRVLNRDATKENIQQLKSFLQQSSVNDEVVVFLAGHGLLDEKFDYYFGTTDIDFSHPARRGLPYDAIEDLLNGIPARKKLLFMDTCHAGEVDKEETKFVTVGVTKKQEGAVKQHTFPRAEIAGLQAVSLSNSYDLLQELFADLRRGSGAIVISAASGVEFAYESNEWHNGVFTYSLLEGMKSGKADRNKDGVVTVSELRDYVTERVSQLTKGRQKPTVRRENLENDFRVF